MAYSPSKVDMAQMNAAIDKVLEASATSKAKPKKKDVPRKSRHPLPPPPAQASKNTEESAVR